VLIPKAIYVSQCYLKKDKYAFIYCHWLSAPTQLGLLLSMLTDTPFGVTGHRWDLIDNNNLEQKMKYAKFIRLISEKSKTLLPATTFEKYQSKVHVIYLGVDINKIHFKKRETKLIYTGVCVASLIAVKGHIYLLNALKIIHEKGYKVKLKIIGDGVLKEQLIALTQSLNIQDYVEFYGNLPHETVIKLLASGDIDFCCLPSVDLGNGLHEGIPVSLMEAMNYGIPCVSTDTGSINELITSNKNGLLVQDKNPLLIAQAIIKLLDDNVFTESIIQNAIDNLKSNFDSQKNNQRLYSLIAKK
jgi:glycosyltransferase involved in cell wall biosynthesis